MKYNHIFLSLHLFDYLNLPSYSNNCPWCLMPQSQGTGGRVRLYCLGCTFLLILIRWTPSPSTAQGRSAFMRLCIPSQSRRSWKAKNPTCKYAQARFMAADWVYAKQDTEGSLHKFVFYKFAAIWQSCKPYHLQTNSILVNKVNPHVTGRDMTNSQLLLFCFIFFGHNILRIYGYRWKYALVYELVTKMITEFLTFLAATV